MAVFRRKIKGKEFRKYYSKFMVRGKQHCSLNRRREVCNRVKAFLDRLGIKNTRKVPGRERVVSVKDVHSLRHTRAYMAAIHSVPPESTPSTAGLQTCPPVPQVSLRAPQVPQVSRPAPLSPKCRTSAAAPRGATDLHPLRTTALPSCRTVAPQLLCRVPFFRPPHLHARATYVTFAIQAE